MDDWKKSYAGQWKLSKLRRNKQCTSRGKVIYVRNKEKILIAVTLVLVCLLFVKSLFLDEVKPSNLEELKFKQFVEKRIEDGKENLGLLSETKLTSFKVVKIQKVSKEGQSRVLYLDESSNTYTEGTIEGKYKAKVRGYVLYVLPYKEFSVEVAPSK